MYLFFSISLCVSFLLDLLNFIIYEFLLVFLFQLIYNNLYGTHVQAETSRKIDIRRSNISHWNLKIVETKQIWPRKINLIRTIYNNYKDKIITSNYNFFLCTASLCSSAKCYNLHPTTCQQQKISFLVEGEEKGSWSGFNLFRQCSVVEWFQYLVPLAWQLIQHVP